MRSLHSLDRLDVAFDDDRLVADAGLLLPATLAHHLGLRALVNEHLDLGDKPGRANVGDKLLTLVMSALAGGDSIDDADALRAGGTSRILGFNVKAPSTLGTYLRSFRWGHVRQLDRVSRELLGRAFAAGAGPGSEPFTIDLDSTICETYGLKKEGALQHGYTQVRGYHPLLAVAAGTGDVLMARLREGRAHTARGAAHFLTETIGRVRFAGASGQLTVRADSGFYGHAVVAACRKMGVRFSITIRQHKSVQRLIEAIPEAAWMPIPYWLDGGADVPRDDVRPVQGRARPAPGPADRPAGPPDAGLRSSQPLSCIVITVKWSSSDGFSRSLLRKNVKTAQDLKGKAIAISSFGSSVYGEALIMVKALGLSPSDVTITPIGDDAARRAALAAGTVAGSLNDRGEAAQMTAAGFNVLLPGSQLTTGLPTGAEITTRAYAQKNPNTVLAVVASLIEGLHSFLTNPADAAQAQAKLWSIDLPTATTNVQADLPGWTPQNGRPSLADFQAAQALFVKTDPSLASVDVSQALTTQFVDQLKSLGWYQANGITP